MNPEDTIHEALAEAFAAANSLDHVTEALEIQTHLAEARRILDAYRDGARTEIRREVEGQGALFAPTPPGETPVAPVTETLETSIRLGPNGEGARAATTAALDAEAHARRTDPATSHEAAASTDLGKGARLLLLWATRPHPIPARSSWTAETLVEGVRRDHPNRSESGLRTALKHLERLGLVDVTDALGTTRRGRAARLYVLTRAGVEMADQIRAES